MTSERDASADGMTSLLHAKMVETRNVLVFGEINSALAQRVVAQILYLDQVSAEPIRVFVNSQGGHVESGDSIYDALRFARSTVTTIGTGWVASAGTTIFLAADRERRVCLPNTRFLIHQPSGGAQGPAIDIDIAAREIIRMRERVARLIASRTGQPYERVCADLERDYWMSAQEAIDYGLVSRIIESVDDLTPSHS